MRRRPHGLNEFPRAGWQSVLTLSGIWPCACLALPIGQRTLDGPEPAPPVTLVTAMKLMWCPRVSCMMRWIRDRRTYFPVAWSIFLMDALRPSPLAHGLSRAICEAPLWSVGEAPA